MKTVQFFKNKKISAFNLLKYQIFQLSALNNIATEQVAFWL